MVPTQRKRTEERREKATSLKLEVGDTADKQSRGGERVGKLRTLEGEPIKKVCLEKRRKVDRKQLYSSE